MYFTMLASIQKVQFSLTPLHNHNTFLVLSRGCILTSALDFQSWWHIVRFPTVYLAAHWPCCNCSRHCMHAFIKTSCDKLNIWTLDNNGGVPVLCTRELSFFKCKEGNARMPEINEYSVCRLDHVWMFALILNLVSQGWRVISWSDPPESSEQVLTASCMTTTNSPRVSKSSHENGGPHDDSTRGETTCARLRHVFVGVA